MHNFITDFDMWLAMVGSLILVGCLFAICWLFRGGGTDEIDPHKEMLWRILDKGDK